MRETLADIPIAVPQRPARPPQEGIPPTKAERDALLSAVQEYVAAASPVPPLSIDELKTHTERLLAVSGAEPKWADFTAILIHNEAWREQLAAVPFDRRLLLLPKCLRDADRCTAEIDEVGLVCGRCGGCPIHELQAEAERLGYVVLVAEGSPVVMSLLESRRVEAVVGVSCVEVLREVFPFIHAAAVPGLAVPLLNDGCRETTVDLDWVWDAMHVTREDGTRRLDLDALRRDVCRWFEPAALEEVLGPARTESERIARQWLGRSGKRWRPFLTVCACRALCPGPDPAAEADLRRLAVAVECFHKASLIHDDIEDDDDVRYEQTTLHAEYGIPVALNVGDLLLGEGYRLIAECAAPPERRAEMLRAAAEGHRVLCIGQGMELCWVRRPRPLSAGEVLEIFRRKTAPAFNVALQIGALHAGAGPDVREALARYSRALGVAYQVRDDLDDFADGPDGSDAEAGRPSILLAVAAEGADGEDLARIEELWRRPGDLPRHAEAVGEIFRRRHVVERTGQLLEDCKHRAVRALAAIDSPGLKGLLRRVLTRIFNDGRPLFCCRDYRAARPADPEG